MPGRRDLAEAPELQILKATVRESRFIDITVKPESVADLEKFALSPGDIVGFSEPIVELDAAELPVFKVEDFAKKGPIVTVRPGGPDGKEGRICSKRLLQGSCYTIIRAPAINRGGNNQKSEFTVHRHVVIVGTSKLKFVFAHGAQLQKIGLESGSLMSVKEKPCGVEDWEITEAHTQDLDKCPNCRTGLKGPRAKDFNAADLCAPGTQYVIAQPKEHTSSGFFFVGERELGTDAKLRIISRGTPASPPGESRSKSVVGLELRPRCPSRSPRRSEKQSGLSLRPAAPAPRLRSRSRRSAVGTSRAGQPRCTPPPRRTPPRRSPPARNPPRRSPPRRSPPMRNPPRRSPPRRSPPKRNPPRYSPPRRSISRQNRYAPSRPYRQDMDRRHSPGPPASRRQRSPARRSPISTRPRGALGPGRERVARTRSRSTCRSYKTLGWEELLDADGNTYYYNAATDTSQWERPGEEGKSQHIGAVGLSAQEWEVAEDEGGNTYYHHLPSGRTQWESPWQHTADRRKDSSVIESEGNVDDDWETCYDGDGNVFYYHIPTGRSQWEPPRHDDTLALQDDVPKVVDTNLQDLNGPHLALEDEKPAGFRSNSPGLNVGRLALEDETPTPAQSSSQTSHHFLADMRRRALALGIDL